MEIVLKTQYVYIDYNSLHSNLIHVVDKILIIN